MPRIPRMVVTDSGQKAAYHVISRTALDGLPFKNIKPANQGTGNMRSYQRMSDILSYLPVGSFSAKVLIQ